MKKPLVISFLIFCLVDTYGQSESPYTQQPFSKGSNSVQLHAGTAGAGLDFRTAIFSHFSARAGFTLVPSITVNRSSGDYDNVITGKSFNGHLLIDYSPFTETLQNLRIVAGAAYFKSNGSVKRSTRDGAFSYGDIPLSKEEIGYVTAETEYKGIAPYVGIGAFNILGGKKININFDFGTYYLPAPEIALSGTGMLSGMSSERDQLQQNLEDYRWLPVIQLNLIYKF